MAQIIFVGKKPTDFPNKNTGEAPVNYLSFANLHSPKLSNSFVEFFFLFSFFDREANILSTVSHHSTDQENKLCALVGTFS